MVENIAGALAMTRICDFPEQLQYRLRLGKSLCSLAAVD